MLRDWSDRQPEPPTPRNVIVWTFAGGIGALLAWNVVRGIMGQGWNW